MVIVFGRVYVWRASWTIYFDAANRDRAEQGLPNLNPEEITTANLFRNLSS
jgi:hypothetical protein